MLIAIAHIVGALVVTVALSAIMLWIYAWRLDKNGSQGMQEIADTLGVDIFDPNFISRAFDLMSERYSNERFCNRLSDLCGWLQSAWNWIGFLLQAGTLITVVWLTATESLSNAIFAWWIVAITLFFWVSALLFVFICRLITGRFPGEAARCRKFIAKERSIQRARSPALEI